MADTLFDASPAARAATHAHTGPGCVFCATRSGPAAAAAGQAALARDLEWGDRATSWRRARIGQRVTADDLVTAIGLPTGSSNQVGAIFHRWRVKGLVEAEGFVAAQRRTSHGRVIRQWLVIA